MTQREKFRRCLVLTFWLGLIFTIGFTWYYMRRRIPDRLCIVVDEEETLDLELPFDVVLKSESEEVV